MLQIVNTNEIFAFSFTFFLFLHLQFPFSFPFFSVSFSLFLETLLSERRRLHFEVIFWKSVCVSISKVDIQRTISRTFGRGPSRLRDLLCFRFLLLLHFEHPLSFPFFSFPLALFLQVIQRKWWWWWWWWWSVLHLCRAGASWTQTQPRKGQISSRIFPWKRKLKGKKQIQPFEYSTLRVQPLNWDRFNFWTHLWASPIS